MLSQVLFYLFMSYRMGEWGHGMTYITMETLFNLKRGYDNREIEKNQELNSRTCSNR